MTISSIVQLILSSYLPIMKIFFQTTGLILSLAGVIAVLIIIPAIWLGVASDWRVLFLSLSYFCFFLGTVWRVIRYGQLVSRKEDYQVKATSGRIASVVTILGLLGFHWLTIYSFSLTHQLENHPFALSLTVIAMALVIASLIVSQVAIRTLGKFFDRLAIKSDHRLVTEGIYASVRHPIYTSYILLFLGFCALLHSLWGLTLLLGVCLIWFGNRIAIEEKMLEEKFGLEYQSYCQKTKRLFPYIY